MGIFLIVIGAILLLICGLLFISTHSVIKDQANWDDFYKSIQEKNISAPEEKIYELVCKMNFWFEAGLLIGLLLVAGGIILQITIR